MNKVLILNGSPHQHGCTATALDEMIKVFEEEGVGTELIQVAAFPVTNAAKPESVCLMIS